jgi:hypothetical protein
VALRPEAIVGQRVEIERGPDREIPLPSELAATIALEDCEDAYGFPPYPAIEHFLHSRDGKDLRSVERAIVASALAGVPARTLRSSTMSWSERLADLLEPTPAHHLPPAVNGAAPGETVATARC